MALDANSRFEFGNSNENTNYMKKINNFNKHKNIESVLLHGSNDTPIPLISIVITTYKRPRTLKRAIDSALNQRGWKKKFYEIVIVDNESNFQVETETEKIVKSYNTHKIRYFKNKENLGSLGNLNRGVLLAQGKWVALLHDDDMLKENFLMRATFIIKKYGEDNIDALANRIEIISEDRIQANKRKIKKSYIEKLYVNKACKFKSVYNFYSCCYSPPTCGIMFKRDKFIEFGGFNGDYGVSGDWMFNILFGMKYNMYKVNESWSYYFSDDNAIKVKEVIRKIIIENYLYHKYFYQKFNRRIWYKLLGDASCWNIMNVHGFKSEDIPEIKLKKENKFLVFLYKVFMRLLGYKIVLDVILNK